MTASSRWIFVVVGILLCSVIVGSGLLTLEAHLAPFPGPGDDSTVTDEKLDGLVASTFRWQVIYLPLMQLGICVGVGLLISGRFAWLENLGASLFVLGLVFVHHATVSFKSAEIFVPIYLVGGMIVATLIRAKRNGRRVKGEG